MLEMSDFLKSFDEKISLIESLGDYRFEIYVHDKKGKVVATIRTSADSQTEIEMSVEDIVYLTEYGTITIPGKHLFDHIIYWCSTEINYTLDHIIDNILERNWGEGEIWTEMLAFEAKANGYIQSYLSSYFEKTNLLAGYLGQDVTNGALTDMDVLKNHIRCKVYRNSQ